MRQSAEDTVLIRSARMLRTAMGPEIAAWLDDPSVAEVMLNPDGRLWIDRLADGLEATGTRACVRSRRSCRRATSPV